MASTQKVTITLPVDAVATIRALVAAGAADSVSGFVQHAVKVCLDDVTGWEATLSDALRETGGELTPDERDWADRVLHAADPRRGAA